eukprot:CAMPEP_0172320828 /NCGR_PEP_ID=MMETSP1058-20130122/41569_1 /TAXON_ID=83371 /ORGANISM="Detonula confervacea, Strain CCMP 353" /LENGTH=1748 /DNA_ID=CAMNT_0013036181 /DNA_START=90 /DNA_END=5336 /DNA_ORIENTATION=+
MPSRAQKSVGVPNDNEGGDAAAQAQTSHAAESSAVDNRGKKSPGPKKQTPRTKARNNNVQLFAFDAAQGENDNSTGGRPKRKLKAIARFETMSFDKAAHCKIGEGFSCPRCSAVCSYDSKECVECQLACYYEAGIGVVVLKERRVNEDHDKLTRRVSQEKVARGVNAAPVVEQARKPTASSGTLTMQRVIMMQRNKKRQSNPQAKTKIVENKRRQSDPPPKIGSSHPTDENESHITAQPAEGLPDGWVSRRIPRSGGGRKDPYWYSPKKKFKFRSKPDAQRFLENLRETDGDESAAILLFKKSFGRSRRSFSGKTSHNNDNHATVDEDATTLTDLAQGKKGAIAATSTKLPIEELGEAKLPAIENAVSNTTSKEKVATVPESRKTVVSNVTVAAMSNRAGVSSTSPIKRGALPTEKLDVSPPPGKLSVRVQLYENELQPDGRECVDISSGRMSTQGEGASVKSVDLQEKLKSATNSNSLLKSEVSTLQDTNEAITNILRAKGDALREAETTIAKLRQEALSATDNSRQISDEVAELQNSQEAENTRASSLEISLGTEKSAVQDLKRQLGHAENDIVKLTQQNNTLNELNENTTSQKEKQAARIEGIIKSLQTATEKKNDLMKQLSELQVRHDSILSNSAKAESELRETKSKLEGTIQETKNSSSHVSDLEKKLSLVSAERNELATKVEKTTAALSAMQEEVSKGSFRLVGIQSEMGKMSFQRNTAEERVKKLLFETKRANETMSAMQSEKDELMMKVDGVNAKLGTLKLENEVRLNKSETVCTEKQKEIETLKQQASKRMSQVYELTDQLSTALTEKTELVAKLESTTANLSKMRDESASQTAKISYLESSVASLTTQRDMANSQTAQSSSVEGGKMEFTRLETEKAAAVAQSKILDNTVDELQGQIERLSAELNASKTVSNGLKSQIEAANAKCDTLESNHKECLGELERVINQKERVPPDVEAKYKTTVHKLEESINQQNEEMQALNESVSTSDAQTADLIAQVSTMTTERDELKVKVEEAATQVSQLQSTVRILNTQHDTAEARSRGQSSDVAHPEEVLSVINSEKEALLTNVGECITRLSSEVEEAQLKINDMKAKAAGIQGPNHNRANGINTFHLEMNDVLSQTEKLKKQLTEEDTELSKLISDAEKLEAHTKKTLQKFKDKYLVTTKDCKAKLKQKHKKILALKADIGLIQAAFIKANRKKDRSLSSDDRDPSSTILLAGKAGGEGAEVFHHNEDSGRLADDALHDDADESTDVQLFAFDVTQEEYNWGRPKRKLKAISRFESMTFDSKTANCKIGEGFSCPRCSAVCSYDSKECDECHLSCYYEAGIGVVVLKERNVEATQNSYPYHPTALNASKQNQRLSKSVLCHCPECHKKDMKPQGLVSHYAKEHSGKPQWQKATYSCPFCPSTTRDSKSLGEVEAHVNAAHPGRRLLKPNTSKKSSKKHQEVQAGLKSDKTTEERGAIAENQGPPSWAWSKIEHAQLLLDGGKDQEYPRDLRRVINMVDEQCQTQEEIVEVARVEWKEVCKNEAEAEAKALDEERLLYKRGIRERSRMADQEKLEKLRYSEKADEMMMRYVHEVGGKQHNKKDIEVTRLCSRPIVFSDQYETHLGENARACLNDECQLCKKNSFYRQQVLLENEINEFKLGAPSTESPLIQKTTKLLNPTVRLIGDDYFLHAKGDSKSGGTPPKDGTIKQLKEEEDKLGKLKNAKHSLEFIKRYNDGYVTNAWGGTRKNNWNRKSS